MTAPDPGMAEISIDMFDAPAFRIRGRRWYGDHGIAWVTMRNRGDKAWMLAVLDSGKEPWSNVGLSCFPYIGAITHAPRGTAEGEMSLDALVGLSQSTPKDAARALTGLFRAMAKEGIPSVSLPEDDPPVKKEQPRDPGVV